MTEEEQKDEVGNTDFPQQETLNDVVVAESVRSFGEQLKAAIAITKENFLSFLGIGLFGMVGAGAIAMLWAWLSAGFMSKPSLVKMALFPLIGTCLMAIPILLMFTAFFVMVTGRASSIGEAYKGAAPKFLGMALLSMITSLAMSGGYAMLIVPGIILSVWFYFAGYIHVAEDMSPLDSLVQSKEYTRGHFKLVAIRLLLIFLVMLALMIPIAAFLLIPVAGIFAVMLGAYFVGVVFFAFGYVLYSDLASGPKAIQVRGMPIANKLKSLSLALVGIVVALALGGWNLKTQISAFQNSPMRGMLKLASGDMSSEATQQEMQKMMNAQLQQLATQNADMPPEMREMLNQMAGAQAKKKKPAVAAQAQPPKPEAAEAQVDAVAPADKDLFFEDTIAELLSSSDWMVRKETVVSLGWLGLKEFAPELKIMTKDSNAEVRREARKALALVRKKNK